MKNIFCKIRMYFKKHYIWFFTLGLAAILIGIWSTNNYHCIVDFFFGKDYKNIDVLKFIGLCCGGVIVILQLQEASKRNKNMERQNDIAECGQVNTRFKDAAILLGSENTASILSGIFALHRIAKENESYRKTINDIFCAYIRESSNLDHNKKPISSNKPTIVIQTLVDVLFSNKDDIYGDFDHDLRSVYLCWINFKNAIIRNLIFSYANLGYTEFNNSTIKNINFSYSCLYGIKFTDCIIEDTQINHINEMELIRFEGESRLKNVTMCTKMRYIKFDKEVKFENVDFTGSPLEGLSYEEIIEKSFELTM